eukprot:1183249-Prorocentrum_minimum.AAC.1
MVKSPSAPELQEICEVERPKGEVWQSKEEIVRTLGALRELIELELPRGEAPASKEDIVELELPKGGWAQSKEDESAHIGVRMDSKVVL